MLIAGIPQLVYSIFQRTYQVNIVTVPYKLMYSTWYISAHTCMPATPFSSQSPTKVCFVQQNSFLLPNSCIFEVFLECTSAQIGHNELLLGVSISNSGDQIVLSFHSPLHVCVMLAEYGLVAHFMSPPQPRRDTKDIHEQSCA